MMLAVSMPPDLITLPAFMSGTSEHKSDPAPNPTKQKPKLSLQTSALSTAFGGLTKGLTGNVSTQATTTPTTNNTFANTWDLSFRPSPVSRTSSPRPVAPTQTESPEQPYTIVLPFGVKPILKNSPLPLDCRGSVTSPRESRRRVFFPQPKKVSFKRHLEEVIETVEYLAKHSDLSSSSDSESTSSDNSVDSFQCDASSKNALPASPPPAKRRRGRRDSGIRMNSESPAEEENEAEDSVEINVTPRADRKRRRWEWTLAPIRTSPPITEVSPYRDETSTIYNVDDQTKVRKSADPGSTPVEDCPTPRSGGQEQETCCAPEIEGSNSSSPVLEEITSDTKDCPRISGMKEDEEHGNEATKEGIDNKEDGG